MTKLAWILLTVIGVICLSLWILNRHLNARSYVRTTAAQVDREIRGQLPLGTSKAEVEAYLERKAIPHSWTQERAAGAEHRNEEIGMIRGTSVRGLIETSLQLSFKFDDQSRLTSYSIKELYTGP